MFWGNIALKNIFEISFSSVKAHVATITAHGDFTDMTVLTHSIIGELVIFLGG